MNYNAKIINRIIKQLPSNKNLVNSLMKVLSLSRETTYRRMRNQIPFSFEEVVILAKYFNISIDELLEIKEDNNFLLNKNFNIEQNPIDIYTGLLNDEIAFMKKLHVSKDVKITATLNNIPFRFLPYQLLFKLDYFHYMHSVGKISLVTSRYSDIEVPPAISDLHNQLASCLGRLDNITCIVDSMLFTNIIKKIQYYRRLRFFSAEDLQLLQSEMFHLLDMYENLLRSGTNASGSNYVFYYSFFNLESSLFFFEYDNDSLLQFWIYPENPITIRNNQQAKDIQKRWIDLKIRNSMLITKTTDIHQIEMLRSIYQQISELTEPEIG